MFEVGCAMVFVIFAENKRNSEFQLVGTTITRENTTFISFSKILFSPVCNFLQTSCPFALSRPGQEEAVIT